MKGCHTKWMLIWVRCQTFYNRLLIKSTFTCIHMSSKTLQVCSFIIYPRSSLLRIGYAAFYDMHHKYTFGPESKILSKSAPWNNLIAEQNFSGPNTRDRIETWNMPWSFYRNRFNWCEKVFLTLFLFQRFSNIHISFIIHCSRLNFDIFRQWSLWLWLSRLWTGSFNTMDNARTNNLQSIWTSCKRRYSFINIKRQIESTAVFN